MPNAYSRAAKAHNHDNEGIRLQKLLAQAGFGSRGWQVTAAPMAITALPLFLWQPCRKLPALYAG